MQQVNVLNAFMIASYVMFAAFYALLDWSALKLLSLAVLANLPFFFFPLFLHRYSEIAAATYESVIRAFNDDGGLPEDGLRILINEAKKQVKLNREVLPGEVADLSSLREAQRDLGIGK
jgi:hypothetical protein